MTTEETPDRTLRRHLLAELENDDVGLWSVALQARFDMRSGTGEVRDTVLSLLSELLDGGEVVIGFPTEDGVGFRAWRASTSDTIDRIRREWSELGRDPDIAEIAWIARRSRPSLEFVD
jgi:hypothetical protein